MSVVANTFMVFLAFFLLRFCGQGSLGLVSSHVVAMWFHRRLGTIEGLRQVVLFAAWAPLPALTLKLMDRFGFRVTWAAFGVGIFVTLALLAWRFVRDRPEELGLALDDAAPTVAVASSEEPGYSLRDALKTRTYWILAAAAVLPPMIGTAFLFDIQPLYLQRGLDVDQAAFAVSAWSATMAIMALPAGRLVDRFSPGPIISAGTLAIGGSSLLIFGGRSAATMVIALVLYGIGQSMNMNALGTTVARFFGRRHHGAIRSSMTRIGVIATGLGPLVFGLSRRFTGGYGAALMVFALLCLPVALLSLRLSEPRSA
jgi:sugar phosphate permease